MIYIPSVATLGIVLVVGSVDDAASTLPTSTTLIALISIVNTMRYHCIYTTESSTLLRVVYITVISWCLESEKGVHLLENGHLTVLLSWTGFPGEPCPGQSS